MSKFDKKLFSQLPSKETPTKTKQPAESEEDKDYRYKLHLRAIMQQLEGNVYEKHNQVNAQYQTKISDICQNLLLLQSQKYKDLAELFFVRKSINLARLQTSCPNFTDFIDKIYQ